MSTFGRAFRVTTFGESHCKAVGAIIDGCPGRMRLTEEDIQPQLTRRRPGQSRLTTPRSEKDKVTILSGTEFGHTLGTPIGLVVPNEDQRPHDYKAKGEPAPGSLTSDTVHVPRPGHADYNYLVKYGNKASSGGGRSSARETIGRVAAGAVAEKWLHETYGTEISSWVSSIGPHKLPEEAVPRTKEGGFGWSREEVDTLGTLRLLRDPRAWRAVSADLPAEKRRAAQAEADAEAEEDFLQKLTGSAEAKAELAKLPSYEDHAGRLYSHEGVELSLPFGELDAWRTEELLPIRCPHPPTAAKMATCIREVKGAEDSIGGSVSCVCRRVPPALGEPVFDRLEAMFAHAMLSLPATKGFEFGSGFEGTAMRGSQHNDPYVSTFDDPSADTAFGATMSIRPSSNNAGGTLGGISSGAPIYFKVAVKAVATIGQSQETVTMSGKTVSLAAKGRHDPCVLPRTPPLIEAMSALVLIDAALLQRQRLGGACTTVVDGTANFVPAASEPMGPPPAKRARLAASA